MTILPSESHRSPEGHWLQPSTLKARKAHRGMASLLGHLSSLQFGQQFFY